MMQPCVLQSNIILTGYRATGKTTLAKRIAQQLNCSAVDSDIVVEERAGCSIARLFAERGEPEFRRLEAETIRCILLGSKKVVLATGGGAPVNETTRRLLKANGIVFWLQASPETIYARMCGDRTTASRRPALTDFDLLTEIKNVLKQREACYREVAHFCVDTEKNSLDTAVQIILEQYAGYQK